MRVMGLEKLRDTPNVSIESGMAMAKNLMKECYFDKAKCKNGLAALSHYHAKYDDVKKTYKEVHDWSSHGSDGFRYLALAMDQEKPRTKPKEIATFAQTGYY